MIFALKKLRVITVADRGIKFAIQKGMQRSRSTVPSSRFDHNALKNREDVLLVLTGVTEASRTHFGTIHGDGEHLRQRHGRFTKLVGC